MSEEINSEKSDQSCSNANFVFICNKIARNEEIPLMNAFCVKVSDRRTISKLLVKLPAMTADVLHMKRVKNDLVLVGKCESGLEENVRDSLKELDVDYKIVQVQVPTRTPFTRKQFEFCQNYWPVHFREDSGLESKLKGQFYSENDRKALVLLFNQVNSADDCLIIHGKSFQVQAKASESKTQKTDPLKHPFLRALEVFCEKQRLCRKRLASGEQYLCTDCIVLLQNEPCAMCAMALVHGRVKSVLFRNTSSNGAFVTNCQLHLNPKLNHHYDVFQVQF